MRSRNPLLMAGAIAAGLAFSNCDNLNEDKKPQTPKIEAKLTDAEQKQLNQADKNMVIAARQRVRPVRRTTQERCSALMEEFWSQPHSWESSAKKPNKPKTVEGKEKYSPLLEELIKILPSDWTIVHAFERESGTAAETIFNTDKKTTPIEMSKWLQGEVKSDNLPYGVKFFDNGIMVITPTTTIIIEPPDKDNTNWEHKKYSEVKDLNGKILRIVIKNKDLQDSNVRSGQGNIDSNTHPEATSGNTPAKNERFCNKILPFLIKALREIHGKIPFWVSEKDHAEFNTHPKLNVLKQVNYKSRDPQNNEGYLLVQFED